MRDADMSMVGSMSRWENAFERTELSLIHSASRFSRDSGDKTITALWNFDSDTSHTSQMTPIIVVPIKRPSLGDTGQGDNQTE